MSSSQHPHGYHYARGSYTSADNAQSLHVPAAGSGWSDAPFSSTAYSADLANTAFHFDSGTSDLTTPLPICPPAGTGVSLECLESSPLSGCSGTALRFRIRFRQPIELQRTRAFVVSLGSRSEGRLEQEMVDAYFFYYTLHAPAPQIREDAVDQYRDAYFSLQLEDERGIMIAHCHAGTFRYEKPTHGGSEEGDSRYSSVRRKRRLSAGNSAQQGPMKRSSMQHLKDSHRGSPAVNSELGGEAASAAAASAPPLPQNSSISTFATPGLAFEGFADSGPAQYGSSDVQDNSVPPTTYRSQRSMQRTPGQVSRLGYSPAESNETDATQRLQRNAEPQLRSGSNPPLVRTSTVPGIATRMQADATPAESFNPYALYQDNKAHLEIQGDLDTMTVEWTAEERAAHRRLVEFTREQDGNQVSTTFKPVTLEQRAPNSICVSCIWWEEREEAYVTSVDTIQLLESLVAVRFTVEEKNRIRRNLEGFRPLTVAKGKTDSERFFKTIMDFPNPKPRNIEKDVKVFPWHILKHALKKIVGKYSASYASTQSRIPQGPGPSSRNAMRGYSHGGQGSSSMPRESGAGESMSAPARSTFYAPSSSSSSSTPVERTGMAAGSTLPYPPSYSGAYSAQTMMGAAGPQYGAVTYASPPLYQGAAAAGGAGVGATMAGWGAGRATLDVMGGHSPSVQPQQHQQQQQSGAWQYPAGYGASAMASGLANVGAEYLGGGGAGEYQQGRRYHQGAYGSEHLARQQ